MHALSQVFQYAQRHGWRDDNPVRIVAIPSDMESRNEIVLSDGEEGQYLAAAANHKTLFDVARLMLMQGMCPQKLLGLRKSVINLDAETLQIASGKSRAARRVLNLTGESCLILGRRMDGDSKWVFPSRRKVWHRRRKEFFWVTLDSKPLTYSGLVKAHGQACQAAGLEFTLYSLRHTFATRFYRRTRDLEALRRVLGHGDLKTVLRYVHIDQEDLRRAMQKFEEGMVRRVEVIQ